VPDNPALFRAIRDAIDAPGSVAGLGPYSGEFRHEAPSELQARAVLEAIRPFLAKPPVHDPMTDCTCEPGDILSAAGICEYRMLGDAIDEAFNPPGDDVAEVAILIVAVDLARKTLEAVPCSCTEEMIADWDQCARCAALGQRGGKPVQR
jgi:hypothetical protein